MLVIVFDRIFERDDMAVVVMIEEVDHARQAGGLAGASRAGDQEQATRANDQAFDRLGHADLLEREELARNTPHDDAEGATLAEDGDAETDAARVLDREVGAADFLQLLLATIGCD